MIKLVCVRSVYNSTLSNWTSDNFQLFDCVTLCLPWKCFPLCISGKNTAPSVFSEGIGKDAVLSLSFCVFAGTYSTFQPLECTFQELEYTFHDAGIYVPAAGI